ncbi:MAG: GNAT family N-acetyltransferase [Pseudomonadota bacterium]
MSEPPTIETARLRLRPPRREDFVDLRRVWTTPHVYRHVGGAPSTAAESWARLLRYVGHWRIMGFGFWAVEDRGSGRYLGEVGFMDFRREVEPPFDAPEAGWVLDAPRGAGLATEAMEAALAWAEGRPALARLHALIAEENAASIRVAEKLGFGARRRVAYRDRGVLAFTRGGAVTSSAADRSTP